MLHLPSALLLRLPGAQWVKHPELGPGRFLLGPRTLPWSFYPSQPPAEGLHFDSDQKAYLQLHRCQFPLTNLFSMTHYQLQGQTLPAIILDLARPPGMSADACRSNASKHFPVATLVSSPPVYFPYSRPYTGFLYMNKYNNLSHK